jgi:2-dehydro-3-deoxy-D-arabinonate dehydratase
MNGRILAPIGEQEVWAAGVTYERSRSARLEESKAADGGSFYDRVYDAERPELFFKAAPWRVRGPDDEVRTRRDASWSVPEPEIALCVNTAGRIVGFTIGNDMSSRDIEGENPLYLPQAKIYDGSCSLGPALLVTSEPLPADTIITLYVIREGSTVFSESTSFGRMRRDPASLVEFLFRETSFPRGAFLLTGTGIVPPDEFRLCAGDTVKIHVPPIGTLINTVGAK